LVLNALGDIVLLITGVGGTPVKYFLWSWFLIDDVKECDDGYFEAFGAHGHVFDPAPKLSDEAFERFRRDNANFSLGFHNISDHPYLDQLIALKTDHDAKIRLGEKSRHPAR
jgi:hypothetical protein